MKGYWNQVARYMWNWLLTNDHDFFDATGNVVPPQSPSVAYAASGLAVKCGRFSRNYVCGGLLVREAAGYYHGIGSNGSYAMLSQFIIAGSHVRLDYCSACLSAMT